MNRLEKLDGRGIGKAIFSMLVLIIVSLYAWNSFAPHLFGMPVMQFKHAFGLIVFITCLSFTIRLGVKANQQHR